jgi:prolyl oligopeptidase
MRISILVLILAACVSTQTQLPVVQTTPNENPIEPAAPVALVAIEDPYLWLEEISSEKSLTWVKERNAVTQKELESAPQFNALRTRLLNIFTSKDKIPAPDVMGKFVYNFWTDEKHPKGIWRRCSFAEYKNPMPNWELVLDVDALAAQEKTSWVWHGDQCLFPKFERCLLSLSPGGSDAVVVREFDTVKKAFVDSGFVLPEAKSQVSWKDLNAIYVGTDFGPNSLTESGYPRIIKEWKRGTNLSQAQVVFEGENTDIDVSGYRQFDHARTYDFVIRAPSFFSEEMWLIEGETRFKIDKPDDAKVSIWNNHALFTLRSDWIINEKIYKSGSLLITDFENLKTAKRDFTVLFEPTDHSSFEYFVGTKTTLFIGSLEDVKSVITVATKSAKGWNQKKLQTPEAGSLWVQPFDPDLNDDYFFLEEGFTTPNTLSFGNTFKPNRERLKSSPDFFQAKGLEVTQHFATSKDGTKVPYFQVSRQGLALDGTTPTLLEGYGGFEVSMTPGYLSDVGPAWIERGGVYVMANIRGGGEYGPAWHQSALKQNRQKAYDDFAAIAEDLIARKVTSAKKLGITGASNGGLLMGVMLTQRPELFGAIVCQVPLLDMKRYHKLLAGASWMEEYGDPEKPDEWAAIKKYSPYQNVKNGIKYPRTFFTTSTKDDRVHPGHARKMVARLLEHGANVLYYENIEGGHGGSADNEQRAHMKAMAFTFLAKELGLSEK